MWPNGRRRFLQYLGKAFGVAMKNGKIYVIIVNEAHACSRDPAMDICAGECLRSWNSFVPIQHMLKKDKPNDGVNRSMA